MLRSGARACRPCGRYLSNDRHRESMDIVPPSSLPRLVHRCVVNEGNGQWPVPLANPRTRKHKANTKLFLGFFLFSLAEALVFFASAFWISSWKCTFRLETKVFSTQERLDDVVPLRAWPAIRMSRMYATAWAMRACRTRLRSTQGCSHNALLMMQQKTTIA